MAIEGFHMPAEWAPHRCCWMAWPCRENLWADLAAVEQEYAAVAHAIARFEPVRMLAPPHRAERARAMLGENVEVVEMPIDDSWTRDSGPNFLVGEDGELAGSTWTFNAWGGEYHPYDQDAQVGGRILELAGARAFTSELVAEGGGVTVDGEGTVITTESCFLNPNRNPGWSKAEVEAELCRTLGAEKVIWIPGDAGDTETDGHVDGIAAFIGPGRVLLEVCHDTADPVYPVGWANLAALEGQTDAHGRTLHIEFIEIGSHHPKPWAGECTSYVNAYFANGAVIVPAYGCRQDEGGAETWRRLFPGREVVQVRIDNIATGGGGVHCITQQQPLV